MGVNHRLATWRRVDLTNRLSKREGWCMVARGSMRPYSYTLSLIKTSRIQNLFSRLTAEICEEEIAVEQRAVIVEPRKSFHRGIVEVGVRRIQLGLVSNRGVAAADAADEQVIATTADQHIRTGAANQYRTARVGRQRGHGEQRRREQARGYTGIGYQVRDHGPAIQRFIGGQEQRQPKHAVRAGRSHAERARAA